MIFAEFKKQKFGNDKIKMFISEENLKIHYNDFYYNYYNEFYKKIKEKKIQDKEIDFYVKNSFGELYNLSSILYNHNFFFDCIISEVNYIKPSEYLSNLISKNFRSFLNFKNIFHKCSNELVGSGWIWFYRDIYGELKINPFNNCDSPLRSNCKPILVCDLWEHSYYYDYKNDLFNYIENFFSSVNWLNIEKKIFI